MAGRDEGDDMRLDWRWTTVLAIAIFLLSSVAMILMRPLLPIDETRYLTVAWEMWNDGSWSVPHLNGEVYSHKPPMLFWIINLVWRVTGVSEFAGRMVGPAFGALSVALTAGLARALWPGDPARAGRSALIAATTTIFLLYGSATMFDTMLAAATLAGLMAAWSLSKAPRPAAAAALGAALAFGVLAKGPVILVHVMPAALLMPLWAGRAERPPAARYYAMIGLAFGVALVLVSLWLVPALVFGDAGYRQDILWGQTAGRMVNSFAHGRPFWFFLALAPLLLWPWGWSRAGLGALSPRTQWGDAQGRFLLLAVGSAFLVFSAISGKQIHYLIPQLPLVALILSREPDLPGRGLWRLPPALPAAGLVLAGALIALGVLPASVTDGVGAGAADLVMAAAVAALALALALRLRPPMAAWASVAPLTLLAAHLIARHELWLTHDPARIAAAVAADAADGVATTDRGYAGQFSFAGRLDEPVTVLADEAALEAWVAAHPGGVVLSKDPVGSEGLAPVVAERFHGDDWHVYRNGATAPAAR